MELLFPFQYYYFHESLDPVKKVLSMEPFYFGPKDELFGVYHAALGSPGGHAVLIAGPLLNESMRAHYALRQLSIRLSRDGFDVLRFDYSGIGNSKGSLDSASLQQWEADIIVAAEELVQVAGCDRLSIVSARFASNLAARLTSKRPIDRFAMWDPVLTGDQWLDSLRHTQHARKQRFQKLAADPTREFMGQIMSPTFLSDLQSKGMPSIECRHLSAVVTNDYVNISSLGQITDRIKKVDFNCGWSDLTSRVLYAHEVVDSICAAMK